MSPSPLHVLPGISSQDSSRRWKSSLPSPPASTSSSCAVGRLEGRAAGSPTPTPGLCITSGQRQNRKRRENWGGEHVPEGRRLSKNIQGYRDGGAGRERMQRGRGREALQKNKKGGRESEEGRNKASLIPWSPHGQDACLGLAGESQGGSLPEHSTPGAHCRARAPSL